MFVTTTFTVYCVTCVTMMNKGHGLYICRKPFEIKLFLVTAVVKVSVVTARKIMLYNFGVIWSKRPTIFCTTCSILFEICVYKVNLSIRLGLVKQETWNCMTDNNYPKVFQRWQPSDQT